MTKSIDQLLRETLNARSAATPPTGCLDAETAGAFADGTLTAHERSSAEVHVADCARCQALLAAIARMTPPAARAWWRRPAIAWIAPLTVAATTVIVWIYVPQETNIEPTVQSAREDSRAVEADSKPTPPTAAVVEPPSQSPRDLSAARSAQGQAEAKQERDETTRTENVPAAPQPSASADGRVIAPPTALDALAVPEARSADAQLRTTLPPQADAAAEPSVDTRVSSTAAPVQAPQSSVAETVTVTSRTPEQPLAARFARETAIVSSNQTSRWRIGAVGVVQHSVDGGSTWQTQSTGVTVTLTAGSSPSPSVCWLVGPRGVVVITTDEGRSWQRLPFPVEIDLISARAIDDTTATVVTSDGRTFTTSDRGRNWRP